MEHFYDQSPRFKATQEQTVSAGAHAGAGSFGYTTYFHAHHNVPEDQIAKNQKLQQTFANPLFWAKDGGAYDAWKTAQGEPPQQQPESTTTAVSETLSRTAALERFQQQQVTLSGSTTAKQTRGASEEEEDASGASEAGGASGASGAGAADNDASGPNEDDLIVAAQERVTAAQTNAGVIHTDVVGTALAIKDTLKETSSSVGEAHEQVSGRREMGP